jgi:hypothetical protein
MVTALAAIANGKRLAAGLHVAAGNFMIGQDCLNLIQQKARKEENRKYEQLRKQKEEYDTLLSQVTKVRELNKPPEQWTAPQLKIMVRWYKQDGDMAIPSQKAQLLTRHYATKDHDERPVPPLPPPTHSMPNNEDNNVEEDDDSIILNVERIWW